MMIASHLIDVITNLSQPFYPLMSMTHVQTVNGPPLFGLYPNGLFTIGLFMIGLSPFGLPMMFGLSPFGLF